MTIGIQTQAGPLTVSWQSPAPTAQDSTRIKLNAMPTRER